MIEGIEFATASRSRSKSGVRVFKNTSQKAKDFNVTGLLPTTNHK